MSGRTCTFWICLVLSRLRRSDTAPAAMEFTGYLDGAGTGNARRDELWSLMAGRLCRSRHEANQEDRLCSNGEEPSLLHGARVPPLTTLQASGMRMGLPPAFYA